ncbi:hypothetical protein [Actinacidiphila glaucinigra]|uniref:hypothetical protein n=1 Tax=Actinacidiphila glaucinigra TaxID=235986 RepID=UPI003F55D1A4
MAALPDRTIDAVVIGGRRRRAEWGLTPARSRRPVVVIDSGTPRNAPARGVHGLPGLDGTPPDRDAAVARGSRGCRVRFLHGRRGAGAA